jgi:hypothetical protein
MAGCFGAARLVGDRGNDAQHAITIRIDKDPCSLLLLEAFQSLIW